MKSWQTPEGRKYRSEDRASDPADIGGFEWTGNKTGGTDAVVTNGRAAAGFVRSELETDRTGCRGLSMGTMKGMPVVANDERVAVDDLAANLKRKQ